MHLEFFIPLLQFLEHLQFDMLFHLLVSNIPLLSYTNQLLMSYELLEYLYCVMLYLNPSLAK